MTREQFAELIHWSWIIWIFGIINIAAMLPQLIQIIRTKKTDGLNLSMITIYLAVQIAFGFQGFFRRDTMLMVTLWMSACISFAIIVLVKRIRGARRPSDPKRLKDGMLRSWPLILTPILLTLSMIGFGTGGEGTLFGMLLVIPTISMAALGVVFAIGHYRRRSK